MIGTIYIHALDQSPSPPHSLVTRGQSRGGGLITSNRTRWSRFLGRVVVTHVQGSPKGGGALCVRRVINARLAAGASASVGAWMRTLSARTFAIIEKGWDDLRHPVTGRTPR